MWTHIWTPSFSKNNKFEHPEKDLASINTATTDISSTEISTWAAVGRTSSAVTLSRYTHTHCTDIGTAATITTLTIKYYTMTVFNYIYMAA